MRAGGNGGPGRERGALRWHLGPMPAGEPPDPAVWRALREPRRPGLALLLSLPLGLVAAAGLLTLAAHLTPGRQVSFQINLATVAALAVLVPLHELLHALALPDPLRSPRIVVGCWPRLGLVYVHFTGELSRNRALWVSLCPLLGLSAASLGLARLHPPAAGFYLGLGVVNALFSSADLLAVLLVGWQVPRSARVRNFGWFTYWREA